MAKDSEMTLGKFVTSVYELERSTADSSLRPLIMSARTLDVWHGSPVTLADLTEDLLNRWLRENPLNWSAKTLTQNPKLKAERAELLDEFPEHQVKDWLGIRW